jgi:xanthine dehydrogenase iron-sulfur cluster and FAD-binding subunit A
MNKQKLIEELEYLKDELCRCNDYGLCLACDRIATIVNSIKEDKLQEEPKKIKGFMLLVKYPDRMNIEGDFIMPTLQLAKDEIEKLSPRAKVLAIVEINAIEGEGLQ